MDKKKFYRLRDGTQQFLLSLKPGLYTYEQLIKLSGLSRQGITKIVKNLGLEKKWDTRVLIKWDGV